MRTTQLAKFFGPKEEAFIEYSWKVSKMEVHEFNDYASKWFHHAAKWADNEAMDYVTTCHTLAVIYVLANKFGHNSSRLDDAWVVPETHELNNVSYEPGTVVPDEDIDELDTAMIEVVRFCRSNKNASSEDVVVAIKSAIYEHFITS